MKVVVAHNRYSSAQPSGENTVVDMEVEQLTAAGVQVIPFLRDSDEIPGLPKLEKALLPSAPIYARRAQRELAALLAAERPDVVHLHNPYPLLSPWIVRTAHHHEVPVVHTVHNFRQVCASGVYFRDGHDCRDCLGKIYPYPAVVHACYRGSRAQSAVMATALATHRRTWRGVDQFLALTPAIADHLKTIGIRDDQITVKPNSVPDPGRHDETGSGLLFVGRLSEEKGVGLLLDAWQRHPAGALGELRIAGSGPLEPTVARAAVAREDIAYLGRLTPDAVRRAMRSAAALVVPSTWDEVCPMVVVEALANARPVLASAKGGLPYLVGADTPEPAGWVVAPSAEAFAAILPQVEAEAAKLTDVARRRYETYFAPEVVIEQLLAVYRDVRKETV